MDFEIYFDDLSEDAQNRFRNAGLWHENIELSPLSILQCDDQYKGEEEEEYEEV